MSTIQTSLALWYTNLTLTWIDSGAVVDQLLSTLLWQLRIYNCRHTIPTVSRDEDPLSRHRTPYCVERWGPPVATQDPLSRHRRPDRWHRSVTCDNSSIRQTDGLNMYPNGSAPRLGCNNTFCSTKSAHTKNTQSLHWLLPTVQLCYRNLSII